MTNAATRIVYDDLNVAISRAAPDSTLTIQGTCVGPGFAPGANAGFVIDRSLTLKGIRTTDSGAPTLDAAFARSVLWVNRGLTVTLIGLTLTNGYTENGSGGGLINEGSVVTLRDATVTANRAWVAGGIDNGFGGVMTMIDSTVSDNRSHAGGGGIYNSGTLTLTNSTVKGNISATSAGGGILNFANAAYKGSGVLTVVDSTLTGNRSAQGGGGIFNQGIEAGVGIVTISGSTITDNRTAGYGGGIESVGNLSFVAPATSVGGNLAAQDGGVSGAAGTVKGGCPVADGGNVVYDPPNWPADYGGFACAMPVPNLLLKGTRDYTTGADDTPFTSYDLAVTNWADFSRDLFALATDLPPVCTHGYCSQASVYIYDAGTGASLSAYVALKQPSDLTRLAFAVRKGTPPPAAVYLTITNQETGQVVTSNTISIPVPSS